MSPLSNLAINGGLPTRITPMPARMGFGTPELEAVKEVFLHSAETKRDFGYQGKFEDKYTQAFIEFQGRAGYADAVCTGSAALYICLAALQLPPQSKVLVSPITDPGTINAIILNQLVPVLMDSMPNSFNCGVEQCSARIDHSIQAILLVHAAGQAAQVKEISDLAKQRGITLIEDCSQAHGASYQGQRVGTFGDLAAFSTMYRKAHSSGGCGGLIYTQDQQLYHLVRAFADRGKPYWIEGFDDRNPNQFLFPALNFQIDEVSCAIGHSSLLKLPSVIERRIKFLQSLRKCMQELGIRSCQLQDFSHEDSPFYQRLVLQLNLITCSKIDFAKAVKAEGIDLNIHYQYLVEDWPWVHSYLSDDFSCFNARTSRDWSFNLLVHENYGETEALDIAHAIRKVEQAYLKS